jgi:hypothetical protein
VITARNGFIIATLLAFGGAKSVAGSHRLVATAPSPKEAAALSSLTKAD